jgi:hypothetical protein
MGDRATATRRTARPTLGPTWPNSPGRRTSKPTGCSASFPSTSRSGSEENTQAELEVALSELSRCIRQACGLPAEEESGSGEPTPEAPEQVSSLAGTTDDEAGAERTGLAYDRAIFDVTAMGKNVTELEEPVRR